MPPPFDPPDLPEPDLLEPDLFEPDLFEPDLWAFFDLFDFALLPPPHFPEPPVTAAGALITSLANCSMMLFFMVFLFCFAGRRIQPSRDLYQNPKYGKTYLRIETA